MKILLTNIRWLRIVVSSFLIVVLSFLVLTIITTGYAFVLAFEAHGKPEQAAISHFAATNSRWLMPLLEVLLTFFVALISTKKIEKDISLNGLILGMFTGMFAVALKLFYGNQLGYRALLLFLIISGFGFLGSFVTQKRIEKKMKSPV